MSEMTVTTYATAEEASRRTTSPIPVNVGGISGKREYVSETDIMRLASNRVYCSSLVSTLPNVSSENRESISVELVGSSREWEWLIIIERRHARTFGVERSYELHRQYFDGIDSIIHHSRAALITGIDVAIATKGDV